MSVTAWQGGRTTLGIIYQGAGLPSSFTRRLQSEPATSFLQLLSQALGSSAPLPAPQPATSQSTVLGPFVLSLLGLHTQSTVPAGHRVSKRVTSETRPSGSLPAQS